jgi:hypothetical protein
MADAGAEVGAWVGEVVGVCVGVAVADGEVEAVVVQEARKRTTRHRHSQAERYFFTLVAPFY